MKVTRSQMEAIEKRVWDCLHAVGIHFYVHVVYREDMKKASGYALFEEKTIELNTQLLLANFDEFMDYTIPHEVAHIATGILYPNAKQNHGKDFRKVCVMMGFPEAGRTHHSYDLSVSMEIKEKKRYKYVCKCDRPLLFSQRLHNEMQSDGQRGCGECRTALNYTGEMLMMK